MFCQIVLLGTVDIIIIIHNFFQSRNQFTKCIAFFNIYMYSHMGKTQYCINIYRFYNCLSRRIIFSNVREYYKQS